MHRRSFLQGSLATPLARAQADRAVRLHREALVIDSHDHMWRREDYREMLAGGVTAKVYKPMTDGMYFDEQNRRVFPGGQFDWTAKYLELIGRVEDLGGVIIRDVANLEAVKRDGRAGVILGNEGTLPLAGSAGNLRMLYDRGMREIALYWPAGRQTRHVVDENGRLTHFALDVIESANRLGIVIDSSHLAGSPAFAEVLKASRQPVIHSHGAARFPRGWTVAEGDLDDAQIRAIAGSGGVIGLHFCTYIKNLNAWNRAPRLEDLLDHVDYLVKVGGIDCVAIGADHFPYNRRPLAAPVRQDGGTFVEDRDWGETFVTGIERISGMPLFTRGLVERGYTDEHVRKILGLNMVRLLRQVWRS